jgi:hypothetical protein
VNLDVDGRRRDIAIIAYKFLNRAYLDRLLDHGEVRVGTATSFAQSDGTSGGRNDELEMHRRFRPGKGAFVRMDQLPGHPLNLPTAFIEVKTDDPLYTLYRPAGLYCASLAVTPGMKRKMAEMFGCDTYVRIDDFVELAKAIHHNSILGWYVLGIGPVEYREVRDIPWISVDDDIHPLHKRPEYSWQKEVRMVWNGYQGGPITVKVPNIRQLVSYKKAFDF